MKTLATGLLVLLSVLVAQTSIAQQGSNAPPETIFYNGKVITVDRGFTIAQAFAVRGEQYIAVGTSAEIRALAGANSRLVDLRGSAVVPGLSDNHDHLYNSAKVMRGIDLVGATSTAEVLRRLREGLAKAKAGETVFGSVGWRAALTKNDLDQISTDVPIVALRGRRGAAVMNSAALKKAGIAKDMQSYMGKEIPKDLSGELTGELPDYPAGLHAIDKVVPLPTPDEEDEWIAAGQKQRNALGITSIRDLSNWPPGMRAFGRMWRQGRLTVRVSMGLELAEDLSDPASLVRRQIVAPGFGDHWLRIDSAGERPNPPAGDATPEKYKAVMLELNRLGWRHAPHAESNEALEAVLQAYEAADRESPIRDKRWVVEHIPHVTPPLMERLAKLGVIVSTNMAGYAGSYDAAVRALGREQAQRQTPVREMLDHRLVVVIGSDYGGPTPETATSNNPFVPLYYYVSRKTRDGRVLGPHQRVSREEALRIATYNNAFVTWEEKVKGSIEPGKLADFLVLSGDFMTIPEDEILKLHPMATYVGGRKVYEAPEANGAF
jgi:predicted amidohydrolase YtcJ